MLTPTPPSAPNSFGRDCARARVRRRGTPSWRRRAPAALCWLTIAVAIAATAAIVIRGCRGDVAIPARYAAYLLFEDFVPGVIALYLVGVRPLRPSLLLALGLPTGFALELFTFIGLSAVGHRELMPWIPLGWMAAGALRYRRTRDLAWPALSPRQLAAAAALAVLGLASVVTAASQMYAESPLIDGLPQRPIFHDWVYLLSRAAVIKHHWPFEDPSLAGMPLQYHYFLLVHVAGASVTTKVAVSWILLRLAVVPLGFVLLAQAYALGSLIARSRAVGIVAAALLLVPGELSFASDYDHLHYLGHFVRWLYVSPTFFFGVIYFAALLLAVRLFRLRLPHLLWLGVLAAAGTGAKGSVLPTLLGATALFGVTLWIRERRFPREVAVAGATMLVAFVAVYAVTMAACGSGEALVEPFRICRVTDFWNDYAVPVQRALKRGLHAPAFGTWLGMSLVAMGVVAGTAGVRILAIPYLFWRPARHRRRLGAWLAAAMTSSVALGLMLHFDGDSELYFLLPQRIPMAVLAAALLAAAFTAWRRRERGTAASAVRWGWRGAGCAAGVAVAAALGIQTVNTVRCQTRGVCDWLHFDAGVRINDDLLPLYETMTWLRRHTEPDAVLLSNAFTPATLREGRGMLVDHTTVGVYYYYSALAERRVWIEGPTYLLDQGEVRRRLRRAAETFYLNRRPPLAMLRSGPSYVIIDRSLKDGASLSGALATERVFQNGRFEVFHVKLPPPTASTLVSTQ